MTQPTLTEVRALYDALDDEHKAWATYDRVVADFGPVRPFVNIREAEARHVAALTRLFERYGLPVPENPWIGRVESYPSVQAACLAGVDAEVANAALYDALLASAERPEIRAVFERLREASQERHLPAFRRGAGGGGRGPRTGGGMRRRCG